MSIRCTNDQREACVWHRTNQVFYCFECSLMLEEPEELDDLSDLEDDQFE